jgi:phage repressor protein C with HTH and peptisase S24 domain
MGNFRVIILTYGLLTHSGNFGLSGIMSKKAPALLPNNIRKLRKMRGWSQEELAAKLGVFWTKISKDERGERKLTQEKIATYAKALNCSEADILGLDNHGGQSIGSDAMRMDQAIPVKSGIDTVPILGHAEGSDEAINFSDGEPIGYAPRHPNQIGAKHSFSLYVRGSSMEDRYHEGELVYIIKGRSPLPGQDCVVELINGNGFLKRFEKRTDKEIVCRQLNPEKKWARKLSEVRAIHAVVCRG